MSFFEGDVVAKEQLAGVIGSATTAPPPPTLLPARGVIPARRLAQCILVTADGHILLNLNLNKPIYFVIN